MMNLYSKYGAIERLYFSIPIVECQRGAGSFWKQAAVCDPAHCCTFPLQIR
jgi:hypothetical protein